VGEKISAENLLSILYVIGQDCECGLDLSWVGGTMLPMQWNQKMESRLAKSLGFDPENPYVKMEVSRIIGRSRRPVAAGKRNAPTANTTISNFNTGTRAGIEDSVVSVLFWHKMFKPLLVGVGFLLILLLVSLNIYMKGQKKQ